MTALTAQGMTIMRLFVVQVIVVTAHGATHYSVNKQTNNILNLKPSGDRNYLLMLAARRGCFLEETKFSCSLCFINHYLTIYCASGRSAQSRVIKKAQCKIVTIQNFPIVVLPVSC